MATLVKRGKKWSIKMYDHNGEQKWITGYTDKAETQRLANRLENEKTAILRGDIDPSVRCCDDFVQNAGRSRLPQSHPMRMPAEELSDRKSTSEAEAIAIGAGP